jgi:L-cysteine:1D-myo-inositol 2-amino-2-deoxy-alpha-D-glucopyranoside ligase
MDSWRAVRVPRLPGPGVEPRLVDTVTGELAQAAEGRAASLYACGITPYDATHLGHAATYLAWDLLVRAWRDAGHDVTYVQNVTDVDDPLLERAARDGDQWWDLAEREIDRYRADMVALRVLPPTRLVGAVEAVPVIDRFAQLLGERGALYELDADVYYSRACDAAFGCVSRLDTASMLELFAERGGDPGRPGKKDPLDALVWLAARPGEPAWPSGFGPGRPGWHVECAAIATEYLGQVFDVQAGGSDLIFPHHELTASHARVALGDRDAFARRYAHAGMVRLDGEKMSKSLGNLVFVSGLLAEGADPMAVRLALLAHHYRDDWDWTADALSEAADRLARWRAAVSRMLASGEGGAGRGGEGSRGPALASGDEGLGRGDEGLGRGGEGGAGGVGRRVTPKEGRREEAGPSPLAGEVPSGESVLAAARERLADDLDAPGALAVVDRWAEAVSEAPVLPPGRAAFGALVRDTVDALLGVAL